MLPDWVDCCLNGGWMEEERSARLTLDRKFAQAVLEERRRENPKNL